MPADASSIFTSATPSEPAPQPRSATGLFATSAPPAKSAASVFTSSPSATAKPADGKPAASSAANIYSSAADAPQQNKPAAAPQKPAQPAQPGQQGKPTAEGAAAAEPFDLATHAAELNIDANNEVSKQFSEVAGELGLSKQGAARLQAFDTARTEAAWTQINDNWKAEVENSPTAKGDIAGAKAVLRAHGTPELVSFLETFRLGSNPQIIKLLAGIARRHNYR